MSTMPLRLQKYIKKKNTTSTKNKYKYNPSLLQLCFQPLGFVIVRCIKNNITSKYWYKSYQCIRKLYPAVPIIIVDDNSNPMFLNPKLEQQLTHCHIIASEYPACGELLGFYYFWKHRWFQKAVVLHDSVFLRGHIDFLACGPVRFLWHIESRGYDDKEWETRLLRKIGEPYLGLYENKNAWKGWFGVMAVIDHDFLVKIGSLFKLMREITSRRHRSCIERIFAVMCFYHYPELAHHPSIMGDIMTYPMGWGYRYVQYEKQEHMRPFPILVKVWSGR